MNRRTAGLAGAALAIAVVTVVARAAGFGRTLVFARTVGFDCLGSTYQTANTVPNIVFEVVAGGALATLVVPLIAGAVSRGDTHEASSTTSALLTWALTLLIPAGLLVAVLARPIISVLIGTPPGGCDRTAVIDVGSRMLQVFAPQ
ncbi:MAG: putative peptidoglycan lipid flippase, partial [Frankiales bacterium]|nr:putative peptidoglycan lipid flippase [Frankiales bacterium]